MIDVSDLEMQIRQKLAAAEEAKQHCRERVEQERIELERRYERFGRAADRILAAIIRPRLEKLAAHFDNAQLVPAGESSRFHAVCRFRHSDRFPATTTLGLSVSHDERVERLVVGYSLEILPVFMKFEGRDEKAFPLDQVDEAELGAWIDGKLLSFVDTYLRLELADAYQQQSLVTDPVCGSRITKSCAVAREERGGRTYYFCSQTCHGKFTASASSYVH